MLHIKRLVFAYFSAADCSFDKEIFYRTSHSFHRLSSNKRLFNILFKNGRKQIA